MAQTTEQYLQALAQRVHEELVNWNGNPDKLLAKIIACQLHSMHTQTAVEEAIALVIGDSAAVKRLIKEVAK